jgi:hypothetical protein
MTIKTSINTSIKMCFWNTGGLKSKNNDKTSDPIFLKEIEKYDLIFLAETHVGYKKIIERDSFSSAKQLFNNYY